MKHVYISQLLLATIFLCSYGDGFTVITGTRQQQTLTIAAPLFSSQDAKENENFDLTAFELRNESRRKFGLKPILPEEFLALEQQAHEIGQQFRAEASAATVVPDIAQTKLEKERNKERKKNRFLKSILGVDTCESNYDCQQPEICCNFGVVKKCCASGKRIASLEYAPVTVPVDIRTQPGNTGSSNPW